MILVLAIGSCRPRQKGCTDALATNFDLSAEQNCCCEYPRLKIQIDYREDDTTGLTLDRVRTDAGGHPYRVKSFLLVLSGLGLRDTAGLWHFPRDTVTHTVLDSTGETIAKPVSENLIVLTPTARSFTLGEMKWYGDFDHIRLRAGLLPEQAAVVNAPAGSIFATIAKSSGLLVRQRWIIETDTSVAHPQTDTFHVIEDGVNFELSLASPRHVNRGQNPELHLAVTIPKWLDSIDWQADSVQILTKLAANVPQAVSLVQ